MRRRAAATPGVRAPSARVLEGRSPWRLPFAIAVVAVVLSLIVLVIAALDAANDGRHPVASAISAITGDISPWKSDDAAKPKPAREPVTPSAVVRSLDEVRQAELQRTIATAPEGMSIVVTRIEDGLQAEVRGDRLFYAASLFKLAVLYEAERQRSAGEIDFATTIYPEFSEDLGTSGELPAGADGSLSIEDALYYMVTRSDNASAVGLMHFLGTSRIDESLHALGIFDTSVNTGELPATAAGMARLMRAIVTGEGVDGEARAHMRALLLAQTHRFGVPSTTPAGIMVGNKTGTWEGALHDVAFVEAHDGTYVIAVLTDGSQGWDGIADWGRRVFDVLAGG